MRNYIYLHAIENNAPIPIGTQDPGILDARLTDADVDDVIHQIEEILAIEGVINVRVFEYES